MGLNRDACTEYLANNGASSGEGDAFISRLSPHYLHHHVQSSKAAALCALSCQLHAALRSAPTIGALSGGARRQNESLINKPGVRTLLSETLTALRDAEYGPLDAFSRESLPILATQSLFSPVLGS